MDLQTKLKDQYVAYRNILKEKNVIEEIKQNVSGTKEVTPKAVSKDNARKWYAKTY